MMPTRHSVRPVAVLRAGDQRTAGLGFLEAFVSAQRGDLGRSVRLLLPFVSGQDCSVVP